jgi:hypothetical protein
MYTWALFKDCKVTEIIFGSKSQLHYFQLITKKYGQLLISVPSNPLPDKKRPRMGGAF